MIEMDKIMLVWIIITGKVFQEVNLDIQRNLKMVIMLQVVKMVISKQQQLSFMELIHKKILNKILIVKIQLK